ncbi:endonuclease domain-containing protein [Cellulomonas composti]|uniref:DUF559 domain-containing protein n=1 Tax=Cellulomonas composti TaxID=266130 RepID=A0A511J655_9CELL|nr:DUF559 domain-containing protein [Cellulomonas composti]GEL93490.1 hypothetical protein CCO02nite_01480 [Cellulomonas composti]
MPRAAVNRVFTARQAYDEGRTRRQVRHAIDSGRWRRLVGDALVEADVPATPQRLALGAVLTWPAATVAFTTAALVHGLPVEDDDKVHVFVPTRRPARGRLTPHLVPVGFRDRQRLGPGSVTTRWRTVIDCLGRLDPDESDRLLAWVAAHDTLPTAELERWLAEHPGALGNARRRVALRRLRSGAVSVAEERLLAILRRAGIKGWRANVPLYDEIGVWARADVWFAAVRLVLEVDGEEAHRGRFQQDRTRQNALVAAGCTVLRYTWADLTARPLAVAEEIDGVLTALLHKRSA